MKGTTIRRHNGGTKSALRDVISFHRYADIEPLANNCTEILVWHTMTAVPQPHTYSLPRTNEISNLKGLFKTMTEQGIVSESGPGDRNVKEIELCIGHECQQ